MVRYLHENIPSPFWYDQWRIQDFPKEGAPTPPGGAPTYDFAKFSQKTAWNWKNLDPWGGVSHAPLRSATALSLNKSRIYKNMTFLNYTKSKMCRRWSEWIEYPTNLRSNSMVILALFLLQNQYDVKVGHTPTTSVCRTHTAAWICLCTIQGRLCRHA